MSTRQKKRNITALDVSGVGKRFVIHQSSRKRLFELIFKPEISSQNSIWALRDISFRLEKGECLGIVGNNGSGKSTLLKIIVGTLRPSEGQVSSVGNCIGLLELGTGLNPDLSGRHNLYHLTDMLGFDRAWLESNLEQIINFSGLEECIDRPVKTYSSGMALRLSFSLYSLMEPDVLVIDEALAVGDAAFQLKCVTRLEELLQDKKCAVILVSHDLNALERFCNKAMWLENGQMRMFGSASQVVKSYTMKDTAIVENDTVEKQRNFHTKVPSSTLPRTEIANLYETGVMVIDTVWAEDAKGSVSQSIETKRYFQLCVRVTAQQDISNYVLGIRVTNSANDLILSTNTHFEGVQMPSLRKQKSVTIRWPFGPNLVSGEYFISFGVSEVENLHNFFSRHVNAYSLRITGKSNSAGMLNLNALPSATISD